MAALEGPYVVLGVDWSPTLSTTYQVERRIGTDGEAAVVATGQPILGAPGFSVFTDVTAPLGVDLYYQFTSNTGATTGWVGPYVNPDTGQVWLTDPVRPWADVAMDICPPGAGNHRPDCPDPDPSLVWGGFTRELTLRADVGLFDILNAERPADVHGRRKYADGSIRFFSLTLDAIERVYELFTSGGPLMLRVPTVYGWQDRVIQPLDLEMSYVSRDQRRPLRQWDVPFSVVDPPNGPIQGGECSNWCAVRDAFPTFADLTAYPANWADLASGAVLCPDVDPGENGFGMGGFGDGPYGDGG